MNMQRLIPLVLAFTAGPVLSQQTPGFSSVDMNGEDAPSVTELQAALHLEGDEDS